MNVQLSQVSATRKTLVVALDAAEVTAEHQAVVADIAKIASLPGFRPGKAPAAMVAKRYHKEIDGEFKQKLMAKAYRDGLEQQKLDVLNIVKVDEGTLQPGAAATITFTIDIRPEFTLPTYTELKTVIAELR